MTRFVRAFLTLLLFLSICAPSALAKGGKSKKDNRIEEVGIVAFDRVFDRVDTIDRTVRRTERKVKRSKKDLNAAVGLKKSAPVADAFGKLRDLTGGQLSLTKGSQGIQLGSDQNDAAEVVQAMSAANELLVVCVTQSSELASLAPEIAGLAQEIHTFPANLKNEFMSGHAGLFQKLFGLPKAANALGNNLGVTTKLPKRVTDATREMTSVIGAASAAVNGAPAKKKGKGKKKGKKKS